MKVAEVKFWLEENVTPFAWQRIMIKSLPHFQKEGFYMHTIKDESILKSNLLSLIDKNLYELYKENLPSTMLNSTETETLRGQFLKDRNAYIAQTEPCIFHCHHYNTYLQAVIEDTSEYLNVYPILIHSAQEITHTQFSNFFKENDVELEKRKSIVEDFFRYCGFGKIDLSGISEQGGIAIASSDHYGIGWKLKFGLRDKEKSGISFFTAGYIAGALEAVFNFPNGVFQVEQQECIAKGDEKSTFIIKKDSHNTYFQPSPGEGIFQIGQLKNSDYTTVDSLAIREAVTGMKLEGDEKTGIIDAFGVLLTRMYSNYYCLISYRFLRLFEEKMGLHGTETARELLTEAGHVCAFNTFGGIMQSAEWNGLIRPMLKTKEDWVHGITAVVNAFGWGIWEVVELIPNEKLVMKITSGYESNSFLKTFGKSAYPVSFLATGAVAGIMNLVYNSNIAEHPINLDDEQYQKIYHSKNLFTATQISCRAMDDDNDLFEARIKQ